MLIHAHFFFTQKKKHCPGCPRTHRTRVWESLPQWKLLGHGLGSCPPHCLFGVPIVFWVPWMPQNTQGTHDTGHQCALNVQDTLVFLMLLLPVPIPHVLCTLESLGATEHTVNGVGLPSVLFSASSQSARGAHNNIPSGRCISHLPSKNFSLDLKIIINPWLEKL